MFIIALFTISKNWKQPKYPSTNKWYIHISEFYPATKKKKGIEKLSKSSDMSI